MLNSSLARGGRVMLLSAGFCVVVAGLASAQAFRSDGLAVPGPIRVQATAEAVDTVALLAGLAKIESDLQLGLLFVVDGLTNPEGSHFTHPLAETFPAIRDGLAAAGVPDLEPLLSALEAGGDKDAVMAAYKAATAGLMEARSVLRPSPSVMLQAVVAQTRDALGEINAAGPTEVNNYQDAWAMLMVARTNLDLLARTDDAAVAKVAEGLILGFDDIILTMPDPNQSAPVSFDPAPIAALLSQLETAAGSV